MTLQQQSAVSWVHQDPVTKHQRLTDAAGTVTAVVDLDPWGGETSRSWNSQQQPRRYTSYERDGNASDEAMMRRYNRWHSRFDQPDPYDGSYHLADPQSLNRYSYVQNDPVNFIDPTGLEMCSIDPATGEEVCIPDFQEFGGTVTPSFGDDYYLPASSSGRGPIAISIIPIPLLPVPEPQEPSKPSFDPNDPCANVPLAPPGVDINKNIKEAEKRWGTGPFWFRNMVRNAKGRVDDVKSGKSWDYKQLGGQYRDFGNFNYGATGLAVGFNETALLREAGRAQIAAGTSKPKFGYPGNRANPFGGKPPYGDDPDDQAMIKRGFEYYKAGCHERGK